MAATSESEAGSGRDTGASTNRPIAIRASGNCDVHSHRRKLRCAGYLLNLFSAIHCVHTAGFTQGAVAADILQMSAVQTIPDKIDNGSKWMYLGPSRTRYTRSIILMCVESVLNPRTRLKSARRAAIYAPQVLNYVNPTFQTRPRHGTTT